MTNSTTTYVPHSSASNTQATPSRAARALRALVHGYQHARAGRPSPCRYFPSCSTYAIEALETHGAWRGSYLAMRRVLRCNPFGSHGVDLVPPARKTRIS